ncbi:MAG: aminotransferase class I/II-fold pyridoxal phosphate-dependent enzyme [Acidimicrobiales bacterium]
MIAEVQYRVRGTTARAIATSVENGVRSGDLTPGTRLAPVRTLAAELAVSPATAAAAYRELRRRGLVAGEGRRGTRITARPPIIHRRAGPVPASMRDLAAGGPDARLLPKLRPLAAQSRSVASGYEAGGNEPALLAAAAQDFAAHGVPSNHLAVVGGALDGIERVLAAHLLPGDRVVVEDPGFPPLLDLLRALGLEARPVPIDDDGPDSEALEAALAAGASGVVLTPRAQNPTGAALSAARAAAVRRAMRPHPDLLTIEDDHAGPVAGAGYHTTWERGRQRWAVVRSVSKSLGPDLRLAVMAGDPVTVDRVAGRQSLGTGWVSHILQRLVADLWADGEAVATVQRAAAAYAERRGALLTALSRRGLQGHGRSGLNVWIPVPEEAAAVRSLAEAGFAVEAGERYRLASPPAIRVTVSTLRLNEADLVAEAIAGAVSAGPLRRVRS